MQCTLVSSSSKSGTLNTAPFYAGILTKFSPDLDVGKIYYWIKSCSPFSAVLSVPSKHHSAVNWWGVWGCGIMMFKAWFTQNSWKNWPNKSGLATLQMTSLYEPSVSQMELLLIDDSQIKLYCWTNRNGQKSKYLILPEWPVLRVGCESGSARIIISST